MIKAHRKLHKWSWVLIAPLLVWLVIALSNPEQDLLAPNQLELSDNPKGKLP